MIYNFLRAAFPQLGTPRTARRWRMAACYTVIVAYLISHVPLLLTPTDFAQQLGLATDAWGLLIALLLLGAITAYWQTRQNQMEWAALIIVSVLLAESTLFLLRGAWDTPMGWGALWVGLGTASILFPQREHRLASGIALLIAAAGCFQDFNNLNTTAQTERAVIWLVTFSWLLGLAISIRAAVYSRNASRATQPDSASAEIMAVGQRITTEVFARSELNILLQSLAEDLEHRFLRVHHVHIYLTDADNNQAVLHAATGPIGQQLLHQEYQLEVGGLSPVGRVTLNGHTLHVADYHKETIHKPSELLSDTRSELVLPLHGPDQRMLGALDLQSRESDAFSERDTTVLTAIATQLALAVDALQLHARTERSIRENRALYQQTQMNLREIERLNYQLTGRAWSDYLRQQADSTALTLDLATGKITTEAEWTPALNEAATHHQAVTITQQGQRVVALPITIRNEVIGAMEFELPSDDELPEAALELVAAVGQRLGLALENRRLFDETQRIAQRETLINDMGTELQSSSSVEAIIQQTARHLQEMLAAEQVTIRLSADDNDSTT